MKIVFILAVLALTACSTSPPELMYADGSNRIPIKPRPIPRRPSATDQMATPEKIATAATAPEKGGANQTASAAKPAISTDKQTSPAGVQAPAETFQVTPSPFASKLKAKHKCSRPSNAAPSSGSDAALGHLEFKSPS